MEELLYQLGLERRRLRTELRIAKRERKWVIEDFRDLVSKHEKDERVSRLRKYANKK